MCRLLFVVCKLVFDVWRVLSAAVCNVLLCGLLFVVCFLLFDAGSLLWFVVCCMLFGACCLFVGC